MTDETPVETPPPALAPQEEEKSDRRCPFCAAKKMSLGRLRLVVRALCMVLMRVGERAGCVVKACKKCCVGRNEECAAHARRDPMAKRASLLCIRRMGGCGTDGGRTRSAAGAVDDRARQEAGAQARVQGEQLPVCVCWSERVIALLVMALTKLLAVQTTRRLSRCSPSRTSSRPRR